MSSCRFERQPGALSSVSCNHCILRLLDVQAVRPDMAAVSATTTTGGNLSSCFVAQVLCSLRCFLNICQTIAVLNGSFHCPNETIEQSVACSFLGEALRAVLVLEVRRATVTSTTPCERLPAHLPPGSSALRCSIRSQSGATALAVLGGPPSGAPLLLHLLCHHCSSADHGDARRLPR